PAVSVTLHAYVIGVSSSTPSVTVLPRLIVPPTGSVPGAPVMLTVGAFADTVTVLVSVPNFPSLSVAVRLTVYVPSSVGVKLNVADVPEADWPLLDVTLQA